MKNVIYKVLVLILIIAVVAIAVRYSLKERGRLDYAAHIDDTAVTVDGNDITLSDVAMYVAYEERQIEEQAIIYNADSPKDYWNLHVDGIFISSDARKTALGMAVHDYLFYNEAVAMGMELTDEEEEYLANEIEDFWMDLYDIQIERMPVSEDVINESIRKMALAQKYQEYIAGLDGCAYHEYDWDGYEFEEYLKDHKVKTNKSVWNRVQLGEVTLSHDSVSYINGLTDEEREEIQNNKKK